MKKICKRCKKEYEEDETTLGLTPKGFADAEKIMSLVSKESQEILEKHVREFFVAVESLCLECTAEVVKSLPKLPEKVKEEIWRAISATN